MKKALFEKVGVPLLLALLTPVVIALGSWLATGSWLTWLRQIPMPVFVGIGMLFVLWIVPALLRRRVVRKRKSGARGAQVCLAYPRMEYGRMEHAGVQWKVLVPAPTPQLYPTREPVLDVDRVEIDTPPLCPACNTELEESERYFGGYTWSCVRCAHKTKAKDSYHREAERAERIAKSLIEEKQRAAR